MLDKDATAQAIYDDPLLLLVGQGLRKHLGQPAGSTTKNLFYLPLSQCHWLVSLSRKKSLIFEDEIGILQSALTGTQPVAVVLFQVQTPFQKKVLLLYQDADKLAYVCIFYECFVNATSVDLGTAVVSSLRRHLSCVHGVSKCQKFVYSPDGNKNKKPRALILLSFIPLSQLEVLKWHHPVLNTLKRVFQQCSAHSQNSWKDQSVSEIFFAFVYIRMLSQPENTWGPWWKLHFFQCFTNSGWT